MSKLGNFKVKKLSTAFFNWKSDANGFIQSHMSFLPFFIQYGKKVIYYQTYSGITDQFVVFMYSSINKLKLFSLLFLFSFILSGQLIFPSYNLHAEPIDEKVTDDNEPQATLVDDSFPEMPSMLEYSINDYSLAADENDTLNRITFSTEHHPELIDRQYSDPSSSLSTVLLADLNADEIDDVIAISTDKIIYFIDGFTGLTLYTNDNLSSYSQGIITDIVLGNFVGATVPDIAVSVAHQTSTVDYGGIIYVIDGSNGELFSTLDQHGYITDLEVGRLTADSLDDLAVGIIRYDAINHTSWVANVSFLNVATGVEFLFFDNHDDGFILGSDPLYLSSADFDDDAFLDVVVGVGTAVYFVDGSNGQNFYNNTSPTAVISGVKTFDVDDNTFPDAIVSAGSTLYFIDGQDGLTFFKSARSTVLKLEEGSEY